MCLKQPIQGTISNKEIWGPQPFEKDFFGNLSQRHATRAIMQYLYRFLLGKRAGEQHSMDKIADNFAEARDLLWEIKSYDNEYDNRISERLRIFLRGIVSDLDRYQRLTEKQFAAIKKICEEMRDCKYITYAEYKAGQESPNSPKRVLDLDPDLL